MSIKNTLLILFLINFTLAHSQRTKVDKSCRCPKTDFVSYKYGTIFEMSYNRKFVVCGEVNRDTEPPTFTEFIIAECGKKNIIDFWDENKTCEIKQENDTIYIKRLEYMPVGNNFQMIQTVWDTEKIYYTGDQVMRKKEVSIAFKRYSKAQINAVNKTFESAKAGKPSELKMEMASKLLIAAMSGNPKSRQYLYDFKKKFKLEDSVFFEQYTDIIAKFEDWEKQ